MDYEDPGWRGALAGSIPFIGPSFNGRRGEKSTILSAQRSIYLGIVAAVWLMGIVLLFVVPSDQWFDLSRTNSFVWVVIGVGVASLGYVQSIRSRPLNTSNLGTLVASSRNQFFIGLGVSEAAALAGFVGAFVMSTWWIYLVGASFATIGFIIIAPSKREIVRRQEQIAAQGSSLSLGRSLTETAETSQ